MVLIKYSLTTFLFLLSVDLFIKLLTCLLIYLILDLGVDATEKIWLQ